MAEQVVKRVTKYIIKPNHKLHDYCDSETFKGKNLKNLANYHIRQCYILAERDEKDLTKEQVNYIADINNAIDNFNTKSEANYIKNKPSKIAKLEEKIEKCKLKNMASKENKIELAKLQKSLKKFIVSEYVPHKKVNKGILVWLTYIGITSHPQ